MPGIDGLNLLRLSIFDSGIVRAFGVIPAPWTGEKPAPSIAY